jgi:hypothetical protein
MTFLFVVMYITAMHDIHVQNCFQLFLPVMKSRDISSCRYVLVPRVDNINKKLCILNYTKSTPPQYFIV